MIDSISRIREWPANDLALLESVIAFLVFVSVTAINKLEHIDILREVVDGKTGE